jgi:hypothetical protein
MAATNTRRRSIEEYSDGKDPVNAFPVNVYSAIPSIEEYSGGSVPLRELSSKASSNRCAIAPHDGGRVPLNLFELVMNVRNLTHVE